MDQEFSIEQEFIDFMNWEFEIIKLPFMDLPDNVIELILQKLSFENLVNFVDTNKRIHEIAKSIYSRKYGKYVLHIDGVRRVRKLRVNRSHEIETSVDIAPFFKLIRNFGQLINRTIKIHIHWRGNNE